MTVCSRGYRDCEYLLEAGGILLVRTHVSLPTLLPRDDHGTADGAAGARDVSAVYHDCRHDVSLLSQVSDLDPGNNLLRSGRAPALSPALRWVTIVKVIVFGKCSRRAGQTCSVFGRMIHFVRYMGIYSLGTKFTSYAIGHVSLIPSASSSAGMTI